MEPRPPASAPDAGSRVRIDAFGLSDVGKMRKENEDQFLVASLHKSMQVHHTSLDVFTAIADSQQAGAYLLVVADGVGGLGGGRSASSAAVQALASHIASAVRVYFNRDTDVEDAFLAELERGVDLSHQRIREQLGQSASRGPATTLTVVVVAWPRTYFVHVGDSRAYLFRNGALRQLTRDQTVAEELVDQGVMTEEQATRSGLKNVLTSALGGSEIKPSLGLVDLARGDALLLCTDGLTKHVTDQTITAELGRGEGAEATCRRLVDDALAGGGSDNVSVIVARAVP